MAVRKRPAAACDEVSDDGELLPPIAAVAAGKEMPPASLPELFQFLQCQLRMEARQVLGEEPPLQDPAAVELWPHYEAFAKPNMGANERWVPYHTAFGVHERFLIEDVHHRKAPVWDEKRRFMAIFVFRAHCKRDFFNQAQLPHLLTEKFWKDPHGAFKDMGPLEKSMREYRKSTKKPLLTLSFRMIPERLLPDDDENLVRSIVRRTQRLLEVADKVWPVVKDKTKKPAQKFDEISEIVQNANGLGETWAKMLMVCIDLAYPEQALLESHCDVGIGAQAPLRVLLGEGGPQDPRQALQALTTALNRASGASSAHFWALLPKVEQLARKTFGKLKLMDKQLSTKKGNISNVTLQVQLCEYRQFRNGLARSKYGLPQDDTMKLPEKEKRLRIEDLMVFNEKTNRLSFELPAKEGTEPVGFWVSVQETNGSMRLAERVAVICFERLADGATKKEAEALRDELCKQCQAIGKAVDAPDDHCAWQRCRVTLKHRNPLVSFMYEKKSGAKEAFQTTVGAAGGVMQAERIARLCWLQFDAGMTKDNISKLRNDMYAKIRAGNVAAAPPAKRRRTGGA